MQPSIHLKISSYLYTCTLSASLVKRAGLLFRDIQIGTNSVLNGNIEPVRSHNVQFVCVGRCLLRSQGLFVGQKKGKCHLPVGVAVLRLSLKREC